MAGLSSLAQGQQQAPRRAEDNRKWGLKVPGRPPTPSEGAAQVSLIATKKKRIELTSLVIQPRWRAIVTTAYPL
jgi:hypothetical protein